MLKRFIHVKNVGTFRNSSALGNTEMRRLTLIHGENGRGKTTLCAILRSLQSGDPTLVLERTTLDSIDAPHIKVLVNADVREFKGGAWTAQCPHLEIFDARFVADNVYSGDQITTDHKRSLCRVVLGADGVKLAKAYDDGDAVVRDAAMVLGKAKDDLQKVLPQGHTLESFLPLPADSDIENRIADKKAEVAVVSDAEAVRAHAALESLTLPQPSAFLTATLEKTIDGISSDAEALVRTHLAKHQMVEEGENWLSEGIGYIAGDECPFCGQGLGNSPVIGVFRKHFGEAYQAHKKTLATFKASVDTPLSAEALLAVQRTISTNAARAEFWRKYVKADVPNISFEDRVEPVIRGLREAIAPLVAMKLVSPLEKIEHSPESHAAIEEWKKARDEVAAYNNAVTAYNDAIAKIKSALAAKNLPQLQRELAALEAQKLRHAATTVSLVQAYRDAQSKKSEAEKIKTKAKELLDAYNVKVITKYQKAVNELLRRFGAQFQLNVAVDYVGRAPRASYTFAIRGKHIEPGGDSTPAGVPCFRNTLSSGDRNTLALAFFMAQLKDRADLSDLVIVFDDPFTSLDAFRQTWTCGSIRRFAGQAKQVIVLSHSLDFLRLLANRCEAGTLSTLRIDLHNTIDSRIIELDLDDATASNVDKDVIKLRSFVCGDEDDAAGAIRAIRPLLENHIRKMASEHAPAGNGWLGTFLGDIKKADSTSPLAVFKPMYDDLDTLNEYTSPYAHDAGLAPEIEPAELRTNGGLALNLIGRGV